MFTGEGHGMSNEVELLREATREANAALKDLKAERRALREDHEALKVTQASIEQTHAAVVKTIAAWVESIQGRVQGAIHVVLDRELEELKAQTLLAVREARARAFDMFDELGREIMEQLGGHDAITTAMSRLRGVKRSELTSVSNLRNPVPLALRRSK